MTNEKHDYFRCPTKVLKARIICLTSCHDKDCPFNPEYVVPGSRHRGKSLVHLDDSVGDGEQGDKQSLPPKKHRGIKANGKAPRNLRSKNSK